MFYYHRRKSGKNSKIHYYLPGLIRFYGPSGHLRGRLKERLASVDARDDREYILERVNYYNKLFEVAELGRYASCISDQSVIKGPSAYVLDTQEYLRWFPKDYLWNYRFGDVTEIPEYPAIVKSRPVNGDNTNSIVLNLDKVRHFILLDDKIPFREKEDCFIFRGNIVGKLNRVMFMEKFFGHPMCNANVTSPWGGYAPAEWIARRPTSILEHLGYKYIMALEGNDVASNLKWIMSSNSIAVSPRPVYESWFMEGRLIPGKHYIEVRPDFSDLIEKITYYNDHPREAEAIARHANEYVRQFIDPQREELISLLVLDKYFRMTAE